MAFSLIFLAIRGVGSVISKYTFCSVGMKNGVHTYVDVSDTDQVKTGDRLVCTLQQPLDTDSTSSSHDAVDFDTSKGKVGIGIYSTYYFQTR